MDKIIIESLNYTYPMAKKESLKNINLKIRQGELCSIIGANGSGKTTLLSAVRGFVPKFYDGKFSGKITLDGENIAGKSLGDLAADIGYVFQNPFTQISGYSDTVFEELAFGLENMGAEPKAIVDRVNEIMSLLKIEGLKDRNPFDLSGGQQQRLALASILAMNPSVFVIDEPTSQLDPEGTEQVFEIIELLKKQGKTIVLAEHKMELISKFSDYVVLLQEGEIALQGSPKEVMSNKDLESVYKTTMNKYALLAWKLKGKGFPIADVPICEDEAKSAFSPFFKKGGRQ